MKWNLVGKRKRGRPKARWAMDLVKHSDKKDRDSWSSKREAIVQQWNRDGY